MALFGSLRRLFGKSSSVPLPGEGEMPASRDTLSVIHDLSRIVRNDPEAVDIYLALGNLFRAQGDIERAVLIREGLNARPGLNPRFKARACFELGQDYHRAGVVDRALAAFTEAAKLGYPEDEVTTQLANLFADAGDFERAAVEYGRLGHSPAEAHYLVRFAEDLASAGNDGKANRLVKKALRVYPGSVEAWSAMITMTALAEQWSKTTSFLARSLAHVAPGLRFALLEALLEAGTRIRGTNDGGASNLGTHESFAASLCEAVIPVLERQEPNLLLHYYGALFLKRKGDLEEANIWLAKALVLQPDFWAARLELLSLSAKKHELPPVIEMQVLYFAEQMRHIKRFVCTTCGLRQDEIFYRCPRCGSWHSVSFRLNLQE